MELSTLYIVATPIGNLGEITLRALEVLRNVDFIACENPRHSLKLLNHYEISKPLISYFKHNEAQSAQRIIDELRAGKSVALISDAGMPLISDPGSLLIKRAKEEGLSITCVSGACAAVNALVLSGMDCRSFVMAGFLPQKKSERQQYICQFAQLSSTLIFYAAPHDLIKDLDFLHSALGARRVAIVRELTKLHEQCQHIVLGEPYNDEPRGEYVLVVEGAAEQQNELNALTPEQHVQHHIALGLTKNEAIKQAAKERGVHKSQIYKLIVQQNEQ